MARVEFTPKVAQEICDWIASGGSVSAYCRQPGKIAKSAIFRRLATDEAFAAAYAQACQARSHAYADEIVDIADTEADPVKARNRISARQWFAAKHEPKKYGDRQVLEHEGNGGLTVVVRRFSDPEPADNPGEGE